MGDVLEDSLAEAWTGLMKEGSLVEWRRDVRELNERNLEDSALGWMGVRVLISPAYRELNERLHARDPMFGSSGHFFGKIIRDILRQDPGIKTALDYGCGKGTLKEIVPQVEWREYDPAIPGKSGSPISADLVACTEVLEHVEEECIDAVLDHLRELTLRLCFISVEFGPALKTLLDGRNTHLIQKPWAWWKERMERRFGMLRVLDGRGVYKSGVMVVGIPTSF